MSSSGGEGSLVSLAMGSPPKTPRHRIELELARAVVEGHGLRRQRIGFALLAVIGGFAGLVRLGSAFSLEEFAHLFVGLLTVVGISGLALVLSLRAGRRLAGVTRRALALEDMLRSENVDPST